MPIINSYSVISTGGSEGGVSSEQPLGYAFVGSVSIPANEKFLLIPGKPHAREITLSFSTPVELYFADNEIPFDTIALGAKYRDNQLGVDLWVKSLVECQCLVVIRSVELIDYIGEPTPQPLLQISEDKLFFYINLAAVVDTSTPLTFTVTIPDYQSIPDYQQWEQIIIYSSNSFIASYDIYSPLDQSITYPTDSNPFTFDYYASESDTDGSFQLKRSLGEGSEYLDLQILSWDESIMTFTLGVEN